MIIRTNKRTFFAILLFLLVNVLLTDANAQCGMALRDVVVQEIGDAKYLKDFRVRFEDDKKAVREKEFTILLNKGTHYRFNIKSDSITQDQPILKLFDYSKPYGSNYDPDDGTSYEAFDFFCAKTQVYYLAISFAEKSPGCVAAVVSFVENYDAN